MNINACVAVVAHDAGAANHIFAWMRSGVISGDHIKLCLDGPAAKTYEKTHPGFKNFDLNDAIIDASLVISGTGWQSSLEHRSRILADELSIKSLSVVDHWCNYRERFVRNGVECLPDEIWVSDEYALIMANKTFPSITVCQKPSDFISEQVGNIKKITEDKRCSGITKILFVMEPIREKWSGTSELGEIQAFNFLVNQLPLVTDSSRIELVVKPHPSDPSGKYCSIISSVNTEKLKSSVNESDSLAELIAWSDIVVGCQTYAMVVALSAGKKVISALPKNAPSCLLPHKEIIHLRDLV